MIKSHLISFMLFVAIFSMSALAVLGVDKFVALIEVHQDRLVPGLGVLLCAYVAIRLILSAFTIILGLIIAAICLKLVLGDEFDIFPVISSLNYSSLATSVAGVAFLLLIKRAITKTVMLGLLIPMLGMFAGWHYFA